MKEGEFISKSASDTQKFAQNLARNLKAGDVLAIYGPLGAGKTTFIQGLAKGLGYGKRVFSPTFVFVRPYKIADREQETASSEERSRIKILYHIDLYRIEKSADAKTIGIEEFLADQEAVSAIEWPEKIQSELPEKIIKIEVKPLSDTERKIKAIW